MSLTQVTGPYPIFTDLDGSPLDDGYLYIGDQNDDPETNPIQVFWDSALTIPATQPIRTNSGYAWRNGTPGLLYTAGPFSITIRNKRNEFVLYSPLGYGFDPAAVSASVVQNDFIGDGVTVAFTLSSAPSTKLATNVFINGVYQEKSSYTVAGNALTFTVAPPLGSGIEVMTNETGVINSTTAGFVSYNPANTYPSGSIGNFLDPFFGVSDAVFEVTTEASAGLQRGISVEHYADDVGSYGVDIHQYQGAKSAFVVHCYSDENGAPAGSVAAQIDHTRSGSILTLKNARNAVTSPGTTGTASFLQLIGYPDTSVSLATPPVTLAQWNYQNVLLCPEVNWPFTVTGYGTVINSFSGGTGLTVNHLTPATYGLTVNGKQYGAAITVDSNGGSGLFIAKTSTGLGSGLVIQNEGTGSSIVGISSGSTKYYITKDGDFYVNSAKVLGAQGAAITNGAYAAGATPTKAEFDALVNVVNAILARMRAGTPSIAT
jgi:hypothetical protein